MRRHHHDQLLVAAIQRRGFEERPKHRNIAEPWQLVDAVIEAGADEAGNHERLAVTEFDRRVRAPNRQRRDRDAADLDAGREIQITDFRRHLQSDAVRSEEHTSELQSLMRISYDVFCLKKKKHTTYHHT